MRLLRQSTAQTERIGPFLDATDGVAHETGLGSPTTEISKDGAAFGTGPTGTHDADGWYSVSFTTAHTDTLGSLVIKSQTPATHCPVWHEFMVWPAVVYDALVLGTDNLDVNLAQWLGVAPNALVSSRVDVSVGAMAANVLTATALDSTATNEIRDSILSDSTPFAGANVDAAISTRATPAQVNTECDTALSDIGLDHLLSAAVIGTDVTDDSVVAQLVSASATADWDTYDNTTDSLEAVAVDTTAIEADTQDIQGRLPAALVGGRIDASVGAMAANVLTATALDSTATNEIRDSILSDSTPFAGANVDAAISTRATPAQVNTECDTALSDIGLDHLVSAAVIGTDVTDNSIVARLVSSAATADWDTYANTTDSLEAIATDTTAIETDTQDIQSRLPAALVGGRMDSDVGAMQANVLTATALDSTATNEIRDSILSDSTPFAGANIDAAITTRATPAQVATELTTIGLDHLVSAAVIGTDVTDDSIFAKLVSSSATADWDNFDNTTDSLEALAVDTTAIEADTQDIQSRLPAALVGGRIDASVGAMAANVLTATALDSTATNEIRDSILSDSTPFAGANINATISSRATPAQVATELTNLGLDHLLSAAVIGTDVTDDSIFAKLVSSSATADWDDFANTTDSLEALAVDTTAIEADTQDIQSRLPAALIAGSMDSSIEAQTIDVDINMSQTTPGSPTADTVGEALRKAHQQLPEGPQKNAAFSDITFLMVDETDHATPETGLTVSGQRSLDGASFGAVTGSIAEVGNGIYQFDAATADMNADMIIFRFTATGAADTFMTIKTTPAP